MKIGIIGLGSIGKRHVSILKKLYNDIIIYAYRSKEKYDYCEEKDVINVHSIEELYKENIDAVFITNPTSLHVEASLLAVKNNCNLFIEKPLSNEINKNLYELISITNEKNLITLMGCNMRFNPIILDIKKYVDNKLFGNILSFSISCGSYLPEWRPNQDYISSYSSLKKLGGGVVFDLIHEIDYAKWIFGDFIKLKSKIGKLSSLNIETEDYADIIATTDKNIAGTIHLDYYRRVAQRNVEVVFEDGVIIGDLINNTLTLSTKHKTEKTHYNFERNYTYENQIKYFMDCIKNRKKTFNDIEEGYKVLELALKVKEDGLI